MGNADGHVANLWRSEFNKHGIGYDEIVLIGSNLGELDKPEFIPNVFQLINIFKKVNSDEEMKVRHERNYYGLPHLMSDKEVTALRKKTEAVRNKCIKKIRQMLN